MIGCLTILSVMILLIALVGFIEFIWNATKTALKNRYNKKLRESREIEKNMFCLMYDLRLLKPEPHSLASMKLIRSFRVDWKYEKLERK